MRTSWNKGKTIINWDLESNNIKNLLDSGKTFKEIADKYGVGANTIWRGVKEHNLKDHFMAPSKRNQWTEDEINLVRNYLDSGKTIEEIETSLNGRHSKESIKTLIQKQGNKLSLKYESKRHRLTEDDKNKITNLVKLGHVSGLISKELNLNSHSVSRFIDSMGINKPTIEDGLFRDHVNKYLSKKVLEKLYIDENRSIKEIARLANVSVDSVKRRINLFNIPKHTHIVKKERPIPEGRKHKIDILTNYLGRAPLKEEINKPLQDIFKKEDIEKCYSENDYSVKSSARAFKIDACTFRVLMEYNNILLHHRTSTSDFTEEFYKKCIESGMSYSDISEQIGLSPETIRKYIGKNFPKLKIRGEYVSSGENIVATVLKSFNINFKYDNLFYIDNNKVYIDFSFTLDNQEYWIEYNGKQHYEFVEYFFKTQERFEKQLERDAIVRKYAKDNNIILVELKYCDFTTTNKISNYLKTILPSNICQTKIDKNNFIDKDILEKFEKSGYNKNLIYIFDSSDNTIITVKEACEKYSISETSARRWSLAKKHGLISIHNPRIVNKYNKGDLPVLGGYFANK